MLWWNNNQRNKQMSGLPGNPGVLMPLPTKNHKSITLIISLLAVTVLAIGLAVFGVWAYKQMLDYKNNSDEKAAMAVQQAEAEQKTTLEAQFAEQERGVPM
jgi:Tfp pilus assembly protein PilE